MINLQSLKTIIDSYKDYFKTHWKNEKYKWEAIKHFQSKWNIDAPNFGEMFNDATAKTSNLLSSGYVYPRGMILNFAKADDDSVRTMFRNLFDENEDLLDRVNEFVKTSDLLREKYDDGLWKNHYQNTNAISTYLWLMYPNKYFIYRSEISRKIAKELNFDGKIKQDGKAENIVFSFRLYSEIKEVIAQDQKLVEIFKSSLDDNCYSDPNFITLTIDFGYYLSKFYLEQKKENQEKSWLPLDYSPNLTVDNWLELLNDESVFNLNSKLIMLRMKDYGGQATCKQLSIKYGDSYSFYISGASTLAQRVAAKTKCPLYKTESNETKWWPILFKGNSVDDKDDGSFVWRLRDELNQALDFVVWSNLDINNKLPPSIWKISQGSISEENRVIFEERNVVVVAGDTLAKGVSKIKQGENFRDGIKEGDFFYLCNGNSIRLLGKFTMDDASPNQELKETWLERRYTLIAKSSDTSSYTGTKKWWTPNENSTCIRVDDDEKDMFEDLILKPYFNMDLEKLYGDTSSANYWWVTANPKIWSFDDLKVGDTQVYSLYNENNHKRRIFQNFLDAKVGDLVIGYEANPIKKIVAIARISRANDGKTISFEKVEGLSTPIEYATLKECSELQKMEVFINQNGSLFKLTKGEYDFIMDIIRDENPRPQMNKSLTKYTKDDFLQDVYMSSQRYDVIRAQLEKKLNIILQGAPGVGKTFTARRLAYSMMGEKDESCIELVQFHQNYSYEDFVMGYRPNGDGFKLSEGIFYRFCKKAENNPNRKYFFIIDEINRGNMSKIFGELLMLIEKDYRGAKGKATLAYSGLSFSVPENLYIIGMMNTADRSLAMIDYALRRRFSFVDLDPGFGSDGFASYQKSFNNESFDQLIKITQSLNKEIKEDPSLGKGFCIGHSYFCGCETNKSSSDWLRSVIEFDILPMLREYWFDDLTRYTKWESEYFRIFND